MNHRHVGPSTQWPGLLIAEDNRRDQAGGDGRQHVSAIRLPPFIAVRRTAQMMRAIVHDLSALPVVVAHPFATLPLMALASIWRPTGMPAVVAVITLAVLTPLIAVIISTLRQGRRAGRSEQNRDRAHRNDSSHVLFLSVDA